MQKRIKVIRLLFFKTLFKTYSNCCFGNKNKVTFQTQIALYHTVKSKLTTEQVLRETKKVSH